MSYNNLNSSYFTNNFEFITTNNLTLNTEIFIYELDYELVSNPIYPYSIILSNDIIIPEVIYQLNFYNIEYDSVLFNLNKYPIELNFYLENDLDTNVNYSLVGQNYYDISSTYLGKLYMLPTPNINFEYVDYVNYKSNTINIYKYDISNVYLSSIVNIQINNILELYKDVGLKNQIDNILIFYQNNFNFVVNYTYINYNNIFYPLLYDNSGNYVINGNVILPQTITIVILYNIITYEDLNNYIYQLNLSSPFKNYNDYITDSINIIPINFMLNKTNIPEEIIFYTENVLYVKTNNQLDISNLTHYTNIGETPPLQVNYIIKNELYLYQTYETFNLLENSVIWMSDTSNYWLGDIGSIDNLTTVNPIQFLINKLYNETELLNKKMYIVSSWVISTYIFNPLNNIVIFDYPTGLVLNNSSNYTYLINNSIIDNNKIYVSNNQINAQINITISGNFTFTQIFISPSQIYKSELNQVAQVKLILNTQYGGHFYLLPLDQYGNEIGLYLYKVVLSSSINPINILDINLIGDNIYPVKLLLWNSNTEIIISTNDILTEQDYKIEFNNLTVNVLSLSFYQNSYQKGTFYYQDDIESFYIFINEKSNNFNFQNQINYAKYYVHSINVNIHLNNIFNPRNITQSESMKIVVNNSVINNTITEKPIFNVAKLFKYISLYIGDQLVETITEDTYHVFYNFYMTDEKRKQASKLTTIIENNNGWELYFPMIFWFYYQTGLAIPFVALPYTDLFLKYEINTIGNILNNNITNTTFSSEPKMNIEIVLDTIILDTPERSLFGSHRHEYIIERFITYPDNLIYKESQTVNLRYNNLVKDIFWISKPIYHPNTTAYQKVQYIYDTKYAYYLNVIQSYNEYKITHELTDSNIIYLNDFNILNAITKEILLNNSQRINIIKNDDLLNSYDMQFDLFIIDKYLFNVNLNIQITNLRLYLIYLYKNKQVITEISPIQTINIQSNGVDFMPKFDFSYYNSVIPYQRFLNSPPIGYYVTTFSLFPCDKQPSGHLNFNSFDNVVLNLTNNTNVNNEPFNLITVVKEYQILRIISGLGSLAWLN